MAPNILPPPAAFWQRRPLAGTAGTFSLRMDGVFSLRIYSTATTRASASTCTVPAQPRTSTVRPTYRNGTEYWPQSSPSNRRSPVASPRRRTARAGSAARPGVAAPSAMLPGRWSPSRGRRAGAPDRASVGRVHSCSSSIDSYSRQFRASGDPRSRGGRGYGAPPCPCILAPVGTRLDVEPHRLRVAAVGRVQFAPRPPRRAPPRVSMWVVRLL